MVLSLLSMIFSKSIDKLRTALPELLQWLKEQGYAFKVFPDDPAETF